ncbi:unnamed protein product [Amoebophrya sp. A120]|nr:unnamed protein product [Amoebophrya sp. A120]|eukprot:GSA120T00000143001.1
MSSAPPPPAPVETAAFLEIRNAAKSCMVQVNTQEVVKIGDLSSWKLIEPLFDEDQLLPPLHRIQWLICPKEGGAGSEGQGGAGGGDEEDKSDDGCSNYCPSGEEDEPAVEETTVRVAANEELIDYEACCAYQFVITSVEPVVNLERLPGETERDYDWRLSYILLQGMELNGARSFLYDQSWLVLFEGDSEVGGEAEKSRAGAFLSLPLGTAPWGLGRALLELPDAEADKHERAGGGAIFARARRGAYAQEVLHWFFSSSQWLTGGEDPDPDFVVASHLAAKSVDVGAGEAANAIYGLAYSVITSHQWEWSAGTGVDDDFPGMLSDVVAPVVRTLLDALKAKGEEHQFSSRLQKTIGLEEMSRYWKTFVSRDISTPSARLECREDLDRRQWWRPLIKKLPCFPVASICLRLVDKEAKALQLDLGFATEIAAYQQIIGNCREMTFLRALERCGVAAEIKAMIAENNLPCTLEEIVARGWPGKAKLMRRSLARLREMDD